MKILSTQQIREADRYTIGHEPVSSTDLMERAAKACAVWLQKEFGRDHRFVFFCGNGNNGGDGLAIARLLAEQGVAAQVFILRISENDASDFSVNLSRLQKQGKAPVAFLENEPAERFDLQPGTIIVDAIFGTGLSREPEDAAANWIDYINKLDATRISIDIPSGLFGEDNLKNSRRHIIRAAHTLTFQQPKLAFLFPENERFTGKFHVLDIGLHPDFIAETQTGYYFITRGDVKDLLRPRSTFSHKGTFGHALIAGGSKGKTGAVVLAARACLRTGTGLVTAAVPRCGTLILQTGTPEAMLQESEGEDFISGRIRAEKYSAIGIGPGLGTEKETAQAFKFLLNEFAGPMVIDADALNILSENKTWLAFLPPGTILTPHPGEFERMAGKFSSGQDRVQAQREYAQRFGIYIVLKGAYTSIACPDGQVLFNSSGNPGMATGGSGDSLTGILTGLLAQGLLPLQACMLGVYAHGLAGDIAASVHGQQGLIASDIIENLGGAWRMIRD
jgi:ADP-dependent NAD(P)H-hydrate dehydratase / NAD(P)H-hydrate epimerase